VTRVKTSSRRPASLRHVSRTSSNPPSKFLENTSNKDHDHFHILSNSLSTHRLVLRCYRPIVSLLMASINIILLMRCYNPSVRYSAIKPLNNLSFGYRYSQISRNVNIEHIIVKQSNIICPSISYSKPNPTIKLVPQFHTYNSTSIQFTHSVLLTLHTIESA